MTIRLLTLLLLCTALLPARADDDVMEIALDDGTRMHGYLVESECTDEVLVIRDMRTQGKKVIPWARVDASHAQELRVRLGFEVEDMGGSLTTEASEIRNRAGSVFVGKLLNEATAKADGEYRLKTADGERRIQISDVVEGPTAVEVDSLQIYTPEELYQRRIKGGAPASAEEHFRTAEFCRKIGAHEHARTHYQAILDAGETKYNADAIRRLLERVEKRIGQREAEGALRGIKQAIVYNRFEQAAQLIAAFREKYTDEDLLNDAKELEEESAERRKAWYIGQVPRLLMGEVKDLLGDKLKTKDLALSEALRFAGGQVSAADTVSARALAAVAEKLKLDPKEALDYWNQRPRRPIQRAFYRDGTFVVLQNIKDPLAKVTPPKPGGSSKGGKSGSGKPAPAPKPHGMKNPEEWWKEKVAAKKTTDLRDFLYAFWAEKSGMVELLEPKEETCPTCLGKGYTQQSHTTTDGIVPWFDRCQTCYVATYFRVVQFR
ncbi:MAG: hypothetical protein ACT4PV_00820 [Planctomycetaceae bacterium]